MKCLAANVTCTLRKWIAPVLAIVIALGMAICCPGAFAQSGAGSIQGTVMDSTGAVIPGASINVVNQATSVAANTKSNDVGFYQVPGLFAGTYTVTVTAPNMKTYITTIQLLVAQAAVINPSLTAGAVTQQVEVASNTVQLTTTNNGTITSTLENARINQLPMNGRQLLTLAGMTTPGLEGGGQRANGLMPQALEYVQDGAPLVNRNFGGGGGNMNQAALPDPDAVQEVQVETTNTSAEFSTPGTAIITTKSGTNALHGSFFETARNNAIGIAKARQNPSNYAAPHLVRNEFGASAGGPIIIPHVYLGKDKSFWFFAYERYSYSAITDELVAVPTPDMRKGDFSGLINSSGILQQLYDPATTTYDPAGGSKGSWPRQTFTNNQISIGRLAPAAKMLNDIAPLPTTADNPLVHSNFTAPNANFTVVPTITFRFDHNFNDNNKAYLRYTDNIQQNSALRNYPSNSPATLAADGFPAGASGTQVSPSATFSGALGFTHVFSPTFFSETILSQQWQAQNTAGGGNPALDYEKMLGLPNNFGQSGFPVIGSGLFMPYGGTMFNYKINQIITNIDENLTKTLGRHQMQFGGRYRHERLGYLPDRSYDQVTFGALATGLENPSSGTSYTGTPNTGNQNADFFLGAASGYTINLQPPVGHFHDMEFDGYFQDNYHVSRNVTLNLGLRYEAHPAAWTKYGLMQGFDLKNHAMVLDNPMSYYIARGYTTQAIVTNLQNIGMVFETPSQAGMPSTIMKNFDFTLSPRFGFAYQPFGGKYGTVIRGAYGRYIYPVPLRGSLKNGIKSAPMSANYSQSYTSAAQSPDGLPNYLLRSPQTVVMGQNSSGVVNSSTIDSILPGVAPYTINPNYPPTYVTQANFTIEQPLKGNSALRLTWVWAHGTNLDQYFFYNFAPGTFTWEMQTGTVPPTGGKSAIGTNQYASTATRPYNNITYGSSIWDTKMGFSNDNALQVNYQRLFHHGIAYQISYVWSAPFRAGGNYSIDSIFITDQSYLGRSGTVGTMTSPYGTVISPVLPPAHPAGLASYLPWRALNKYENYRVDTGIPKQHIEFNGIVDLPFGRGKRLLGNSNRFMDELVGGFQIAGDGSIASEDFNIIGSSGGFGDSVGGSNWGPTNPIKVYRHNAKVTDCRSGVCYESFEWFNGYIAPTVVNASSKGVSGLPANWTPYQTPIDTNPTSKYYGTNDVVVTLPDGSQSTMGFSPGPQAANPFYHTNLNGPINYTIDLSLFKVFPITEKANLRVNVDAFNALNIQGYNNPSSSDGVENMRSSHNTPRQLQFTMRFTF